MDMSCFVQSCWALQANPLLCATQNKSTSPKLHLPLQGGQEDAKCTVVISCTRAERVPDHFLGPSVWKGGSNTLATTGSWLWSVETPQVSSKSPSWAALRGTRYVVLGWNAETSWWVLPAGMSSSYPTPRYPCLPLDPACSLLLAP